MKLLHAGGSGAVVQRNVLNTETSVTLTLPGHLNSSTRRFPFPRCLFEETGAGAHLYHEHPSAVLAILLLIPVVHVPCVPNR